MNETADPPPSSPRDAILQAVRRALPQPPVPLPEIPPAHRQKPMQGGVGYHGQINTLKEVDGFPKPGEPLAPYFQKHLSAMGGRSFLVDGYEAARAKVAELFPEAKVVCSVIPEIPGNRPIRLGQDPHEFHDVEVAVLRSRLGVAEAGAVWLSDEDLVVPAVGILAQHLVVVLRPGDIVPTLHEAYDGRFQPDAYAYGVFMAGPSATGDIEGVIIHGAQGARSLTVLLFSEEEPPAARQPGTSPLPDGF